MRKGLRKAIVWLLPSIVLVICSIVLIQAQMRSVSATPPVLEKAQERPQISLINDSNDAGEEISIEKHYSHVVTVTSDNNRQDSELKSALTNSNGLTIRFHSLGEMLITDPLGRRLGFDPSTGRTFNEIPNSGYSVLGIGDATDPNPVPLDYDPPKELELVRIPEGEYTLRITGTGNGTYKLLMYSMDVEGMPSGEVFENIPITLGEVHIYTIEHSKALGSEIHVTGPTSH